MSPSRDKTACQTSPCKCKICISSIKSDVYNKKKIQMFVVNMTFISSREVKKMYISWVPSSLMKYTFFHFTRWNKGHIHSKHLNILYILYIWSINWNYEQLLYIWSINWNYEQLLYIWSINWNYEQLLYIWSINWNYEQLLYIWSINWKYKLHSYTCHFFLNLKEWDCTQSLNLCVILLVFVWQLFLQENKKVTTSLLPLQKCWGWV